MKNSLCSRICLKNLCVLIAAPKSSYKNFTSTSGFIMYYLWGRASGNKRRLDQHILRQISYGSQFLIQDEDVYLDFIFSVPLFIRCFLVKKLFHQTPCLSFILYDYILSGEITSVIVIVTMVNRNQSPSYRMAWISIVTLLPISGFIMYYKYLMHFIPYSTLCNNKEIN